MRLIPKLVLLTIAAALPAAAQKPFVWKDLGDGEVELRENGKPVLVYNYGPQLRNGAPETKRRCCYFYPVYTPAGVAMLDDFPKDHWHHRGLFWSWPVVETGGKTYDIWMTFTAQPHTEKYAVHNDGSLTATNTWQADGKTIVNEQLRMQALATKGNERELEVELTWTATDAPVTLKGSREAGKSYGGFSARFAPREGTVVRADGQTIAKDEDLNPHAWAELEGVYNGRKATLRITPDSADLKAPYQWCLRNYGFVGASFPGRTATEDGFTLQPGKPLKLKFRVRLSDQ
jgi:hypothetical protein